MKKLLLVAVLALATTVRADAGLFRWTTDGGANWTYSTTGKLSEIATGDGALAEASASNDAPAFQTTVESGIVEILAEGCTLDKNIYFDKSFTLRSGEGGPYAVVRTGNYRFESSGTGEPTLMMTNVILDGGVTWKYPTIDTTLTSAANCELAAGSKTYQGTILLLYRKATLILEDGATVRNVKTKRDYSQEGLGGLAIAHHWDAAYGKIEIRSGATLRDIRGLGHVVCCLSAYAGNEFKMTGGLIAGCVNANPDVDLYGSNGGLVFLKIPVKSMSSGTIAGNYVYSRGMLFIDNATGANTFAMSGDATVTNNCAEVAAAGVSPWFSNRVAFSGAVVVKDNFLTDGSPANVVPISWTTSVYLGNSLDHAASIHITCADTKGAGATFGYTDGFTGTPLQPANFVNDLNPGYVGSVSGTSLVWIKGDDPEPGKKYGVRYTTDGGENWTEEEILTLPTCGGILSSTYNGGTCELNIIEICSDVTMTENRTFANSFTIRNAEGCTSRVIRSGNARFESTGSYSPTMYATNIVFDGGVVWKHPVLDVSRGIEENYATSSMTGNNNFGTMFKFYKSSKLILDAGTVVQNAMTKYAYFDDRGYGVLSFAHHSDACSGQLEIRPGAVIRDCRGTGPTVYVNSSSAEALSCRGALVTGCMNMSTSIGGTFGFGNAEGVLSDCVFSNNVAAVGGAFWNETMNSNRPLHVSNTVVTANYATMDGGAYYSYPDRNALLRLSGKIYFYGNYLIDPVSLAKVPNDVCVGSGVWRTGSGAAAFVYLEGDLTADSKIGCFYGRHAVDTTGCGIGLANPALNDFNTYVAVAQAADGVDLSNASDIFVNEVMPTYVVKVDGRYVGWEKGPNADDTEAVAEVIWSDGSAFYNNAVDAVVAARKKKTATVKFLKDARLPGVTIAEGEHVMFTSDTPVTVTTACGLSWPNVFWGSTAGGASLEIGGKVTFKHLVMTGSDLVLAPTRAGWAGGDLKGDLRLSGNAEYKGGVSLSVADFNFYVSGSPTVTGTVTPGAASRLAVVGPFSGIVPVSSSATAEGATFGSVGADYASPTAGDAHGFKNANNAGLCGMLSGTSLVWMRCSATIDGSGNVNTYDYDGNLVLGSTYIFTVNADVDYLNSKIGRKGVYPLVRATSVTGKPTLVLPEGLKDSWGVRAVYDGQTLIGYDLVRIPKGLVMVVR